MLAWAGVGEGSSTREVPETGWREGPLLLACFGRGEGEGIGDEPTDTREDSDSPEEALPQGEGGGGKPDAVGLEVKSVGKPRVREIRMHGLMSGDGKRSDGTD